MAKESKPKEKEEKKVTKGTPKKSKKKLIMIITILIIIVALVTGGIFWWLSNRETKYDKPTDYPVVYLEDDKLIVWDYKTGKKQVVDNYYSTGSNSELNIAYGRTNSDLFAYLNDGTLYLCNTKDGSKDIVDKNVKEGNDDSDYITFSANDKYIVYVSDDGNIYSVDIKKKERKKLGFSDSDMTIVLMQITDDKLLYLLRDGTIYDSFYVSTLDGKNREKIANDITYFYKNKDNSQIYYFTNEDDSTYNAYTYDIKSGKNEKVATNISTMSWDDNLSENIYIKLVDESILIDDEEGKDPVTEITTKELCTYSYYTDGLCSYNDWWYDRKVNITKKTSKKSVNDEIREYNKTLKSYEAFYQNNDDSKKIVGNILTAYSMRAQSKTVIYSALEDGASIKISELKSLDEYKKFIADHTKYYFKALDKDAVEIKLENNQNIYSVVIKDDKKAYFIDNNKNLYSVSIEGNEAKIAKIDSGVESFLYLYENEYLYGTDFKDGHYTLKLTNNDGFNEISKKVNYNVINITDDNKMYYKVGDNNSYDYFIYHDGKSEEFAQDVYFLKYFENMDYYALKNYSSKNNTYDLYRYINGNLEQIAFDIPVGYVSINKMY